MIDQEEGMIDQEEVISYEKIREFSELLKNRRKELGLDQLQVGKETGLSQQFVSVNERLSPHSGPRFFEMLRLLKFYGIEPNEAARVLGLL